MRAFYWHINMGLTLYDLMKEKRKGATVDWNLAKNEKGVKTVAPEAAPEVSADPVELGPPTGDSWLWPTQSRRVTGGVEQGHMAIDVGAMKANVAGDPIWSPTEGIITNVSYQKKGYGTQVRLMTAEGLEVIMAHLAAVAPGITIGAK
ncbi:unnamed protein product, partial [marine sediment metagenome]